MSPSPVRLFLLAVTMVAATAASIDAEDLPALFQRVSKSVVVVRAHGRHLMTHEGSSVLVKYNEIGSGALVTQTARS